MLRRTVQAIVASSLLCLSAVASAAAAEETQIHVRGSVVGLVDSTLTVATREGPTLEVTLPEAVAVSGVARAEVSDIKTGDYVGIASLPQTDGSDGALNVLIFPEALRGVGEGSFAWDLQPNSSMTNATVADAVTGVEGRTVTVTYNGQSKDLTVPETTAVVTLAQATLADLKPGAPVFIVATQAADGAVAYQVIVGKDGVVPPM